jgi:raffinose/stachyose/melibiose transport system substrate-binding protein
MVSTKRCKRSAAAVAVAALSTTLVACGGVDIGPPSGGGAGITIWSTSQPGSAQDVMQRLIDDHNATYPGGGHVSITWIGGEQWKQKMAVAMAGKQEPTVFFNFGGQLLRQWVEGGNVADVTAELQADPEWTGQYAAKDAFGNATFDGRTYGIPATGPDFEVIWQNEAVLRDAGAAPSPTTWDEFVTAANQVKASGKAPVALAGKDLWPCMIWMQYLVLRHGGPEPFERVKAMEPDAWSDPAFLTAAETAQEMVRSGYFAEGWNTITYNGGQADQQMASGQAAFQAMLYYDLANMRAFAPEFAGSPDYSPAPFPTVQGGAGDPTAMVGQPAQYWSISARASEEQKKEALAFVESATTSEAYNIDYLAKQGFTPLTNSAAEALTAGGVPNGELLAELYTMGTQASSFQPYWDQDLPSAVISPMMTNIGELFNLSITPQEFVTEMNAVLAEQAR